MLKRGPTFTAVSATCSAAQPLSRRRKPRILLFALESQPAAKILPSAVSNVLKQIVFLAETGRGIAIAAEDAVRANAAMVFFMVCTFREDFSASDNQRLDSLVSKATLNQSQTILVSWPTIQTQSRDFITTIISQ